MDRWEVGDPTPVPPDAKVRASKGGQLSSPFHTMVYVDDHGLIRAQRSDEDKSTLDVSASLASDYVRFFGPGEPGETPILRVLRFRYQLTHARNFSNAQKSTSDKDGTGR